MKIAYYCFFGLFALLGTYFVLTSLLGRFSLWNAPQLQAKLVLAVAALVAASLLYWAYQLGEQQSRWGAGIGAILLAVLAFQGLIFIGAFLFGGKGL